MQKAVIRELLTDLKCQFTEEQLIEDALVTGDFVLPKEKIVFSVNGRNAYYPQSTKFNNFTSLKNKLLRVNNWSMVPLNTWKIDRMMTSKEQIRELLQHLIKTTMEKAANPRPPRPPRQPRTPYTPNENQRPQRYERNEARKPQEPKKP